MVVQKMANFRYGKTYREEKQSVGHSLYVSKEREWREGGREYKVYVRAMRPLPSQCHPVLRNNRSLTAKPFTASLAPKYFRKNLKFFRKKSNKFQEEIPKSPQQQPILIAKPLEDSLATL